MKRILVLAGVLVWCAFLVSTAQDGILEVGVEWINDCQPCNGNLSCCDDLGKGFYNTLVADGYVASFIFGDDWAWEADFKEPGDATWIDTVDIALHCDHGGKCIFAFGETAHDDCSLWASDGPRWGNLDLEWLFLDDCSTLQNNFRWTCWTGAFRGLHLLCGFHSGASDSCSRGKILAEKLVAGWTVIQAWWYAGEQTEGKGTYVSVMGATRGSDDPWYDHIWNHGSVCNDPYPADYWWYTRHDCL